MSASPSVATTFKDADFHRNRRDRRARKTALVGLFARAINYGIRFVSIPLSLSLLGRARYGLWLTVGSVLIWLGLSELGISTGVINTVSRAYGREDWEDVRRYVSTGFFSYSFLAVVAFCAILCSSMWPGLPRFIGAGSDPALSLDARILFILCGAIWSASFSIYAIGPLCLAFQEGYLQNYAQIAAGLLSLAALSVLAWHGASLFQFALAMGLPPLLANCGLGLYVLLLRHRRVRPAWRYWSVGTLKALMAIGGPMVLFQFADVWIVYSVNILIANRLGAAQVPAYAVPATAFIVAMSLCNNLVAPYVAAYAEAAGREDWAWIYKTAVRNLTIVMPVIVLAAVGLVVFGPYVIPLWAGKQVTPTRGLLLALGLFYTMATWATANGTLLIGLGLVRTKALIHCAVALVYVVAGWLGLSRFGLIAIPISGCVAYSIDAVLSLPIALRNIKASTKVADESVSCPVIVGQ